MSLPFNAGAMGVCLQQGHLPFKNPQQKNNVDRVFALIGDKYDWEQHYQELGMRKVATDSFFDYWEAEIFPEFKRFSYGFRLETDQETVWMLESGFFTDGLPEARRRLLRNALPS